MDHHRALVVGRMVARLRVVCWCACLFSSWVALLPARAYAQGRAPVQPVKSELLCGDGVVFVGAVESATGDERLAAAVASRIADGMRFGIQGQNKLRVASYYELKRHDTGTIPSMKTLGRFYEQSVENQFLSMIGKREAQKLVGYVQAGLLRTGTEVSVSIALYCLPRDSQKNQDAKLVQRKLARGFGADDAALLGRVLVASRKFFEPGNSKELPIPRIAGPRLAAVGTSVVLDASGSADPGSDEIVLDWKCPQKIFCEDTGSTLRVQASSPGKFPIEVCASKLLDATQKDCLTADVEFLVAPRVTVGESRMVPMEAQTQIDLAGTCAGCEDWKWVEISGPVVTVPNECSGKGEKAACAVQASTPGEYVFALTGTNALGSDRKEETVGAAPRLVVLPKVEPSVVVNHVTELDASGSYDMFGGKLRYHWLVSEDDIEPEGYCGPLNAGLPEGVTLSAPTSPVTEFKSSKANRYYRVRLTVLADRRFNGRSTTNQECETRILRVVEPPWLLLLVAGSDWELSRELASAGFQLKFGGTVRPSEHLPRWLGLHGVQTLVQTNGARDKVYALGGTSIGPAWLPNNTWQFYLAGSVRGWRNEMYGPELGADIRIQRWLVLSGMARYEIRRDSDELIGGLYLGTGSDFGELDL